MIRRQHLHVALLALLGCSGLAFARQDSGRSPSDAELAAKIDAIFAEHAKPDAPGCAVGVALQGEPVFMKGYGRASLEHDLPNTPRTAFNLGSNSKQFTALATLLLEQRGKLSLEDDIRKYLPEMPDYGTPIRVRDLLFHTSGLRDYGTLGTLAGATPRTMDEFLDLIARQRGLNFTPGSKHTYSHSDYTLLAIVIERAAGEPLGDFLEREIWTPLGMTSTHLNDDRGRPIPNRTFAAAADDNSGFRVRFPTQTIIGGNNVYSTIEDLLRWERNFSTAAVGGRAIIDRMLSRPTLESGLFIPYAYGLIHDDYRGLPIIQRSGSGGGFGSEMMRFPGHGLTIFTLSNDSNAHPKLLSRAVAEVFLTDQMQPAKDAPSAAPVPTPADELERYVGEYRPVDAPWDPSRIIAREGVLCEEHRGQVFPLTRAADGRYFDNELAFAFTPAADGEPMRLTLSTRTQQQEFVRAADAKPWTPTAAELAECAGRYFSDDLAVMWSFAVVNGALAIRRAGDERAHLLEPIDRDLMRGDLGSADEPFLFGVQFTRNAQGRVTGFTVSAMPDLYEVARDVRFERIVFD